MLLGTCVLFVDECVCVHYAMYYGFLFIYLFLMFGKMNNFVFGYLGVNL